MASTFTWLNAVSDNWTTPADWSGGAFPDDATATAVIAAPGTYVVTIRSVETIAVNVLDLSAAGATLDVAGTLAPTGAQALLTLTAGTLEVAGTLKGGNVRLAGGALVSSNGTLDGVTLLGSVDLGDGVPVPIIGGFTQSSTVSLRHGLTVDKINTAPGGTLNVDAGEVMVLDSETLDSMTIEIGSPDASVFGGIHLADGSTLTLGGNAVVATTGLADFAGGAGSVLVNRGLITVGFSQTLEIGSLEIGPGFVNAGTLVVGPGSSIDSGHVAMTLRGSLDNTGVIDIENNARLKLTAGFGFTNPGTIVIADGGALEIDGNLDLAQLNAMAAAFPDVDGTVLSVGTWSLDGGTLDVASFGNVALTGVIENGTIKALAGFATAGTLDGVTVLGTLRGAAGVEGGLTVAGIGLVTAGTIDLTAADINFLDSESIDGLAIVLGDHALREASGTGTLTLGPTSVTTVTGTGLALIDGGPVGGTVVNQGLIAVGNHALTISPAAFVNAGTLSVASGGAVSFADSAAASDPVSNTGTITAAGADFSFDDTAPFTNAGLLRATAGTVVVNAVVVSQNAQTHQFVSVSNMTNLATGTLTGGSFEADAGATLQLVVADSIVVDAANIVLSGAGSSIIAAKSLEASLTTIAAAGTLALLNGRNYSSTLNLTDAGLVQLGGGSFSPHALTLTATGGVRGFGSLGTVTDNGTIEAKGGILSVGAVTGSGSLQVDAQATLELNAATAVAAAFNGVGGTLLLVNPAGYTGTLVGFGPNDTLELHGIDASGVSIDGSTLEVTLTAGGTLAYALSGLLDNTGPSVSEDGSGNAIITLGGTLPPPVPSWINAAGGDWSNSANWDTGAVPDGVTADPTIALAGSYGVTIGAGASITVDALLLNQAGATLDLQGTLAPQGTVTLAAGTLALEGMLKGGTLAEAGGVLLPAGTLDGVMVRGPLDLATGAATLALRDGITVANTDGSQPGSIAIGGGSLVLLDSETLNNVTIDIGAGRIAGNASGTLSLGGEAAVTVTGGATISAAGLTNAGSIQISGAVLSLDGSTGVANFGSIAGSGTLALPEAALANTGLLKGQGGTLEVMQTGSFGFDALTNFDGAVLTGGSYAAASGATLDLQLGGNITVDDAYLGLNGPGAAIRTLFGGYHAIETTLTSIDTAGTLAVLGGRNYATTGTLTDSGVLELAGGTLSTGLLDVSGRLVGFGALEGGLDNAGTIEVQGGLLALTTLTGTGALQVDSGGTLELATATNEEVTFNFPGGVLLLDSPADYTGTLDGFAVDDILALRGADATGASITGNTLDVALAGGGTLHYALANTDAHVGVSVTADPLGGSDVFLQSSGAANCFATGTRLLTARGEVAVEALRVGDRLPTVLGRRLARVRWIGHRRVDCRRHQRPWDVMPIRVRKGAFARGVPVRDLLLSPDHAVHVGATLIPVRYLVNGVTIAPEERESVTYWHVELERHDVILAEGLAAESYLDTGNRAAFENGGPTLELHPDFARAVWARDACAPLVVAGEPVAQARRTLLARAAVLGHATTDDPHLRLVVGGRTLVPGVAGDRHCFRLPPGTGPARLVSRVMVPAELLADSADTRRLGVAVAGLRLDGRTVAGDGPGWYAGEEAWQWTDGDAAIDCAGATELEVTLLALPRYWAGAAPVAAGRACG